jgi:hypothetical protein
VSLNDYENGAYGECLPMNSEARATAQVARLIADLCVAIDGVAVVPSWSNGGLPS